MGAGRLNYTYFSVAGEWHIKACGIFVIVTSTGEISISLSVSPFFQRGSEGYRWRLPLLFIFDNAFIWVLYVVADTAAKARGEKVGMNDGGWRTIPNISFVRKTPLSHLNQDKDSVVFAEPEDCLILHWLTAVSAGTLRLAWRAELGEMWFNLYLRNTKGEEMCFVIRGLHLDWPRHWSRLYFGCERNRVGMGLCPDSLQVLPI